MYKELIDVAKRITLIASEREKDEDYIKSEYTLGLDPYHLSFMKEMESLDIDSILALQAVMYLGRDRNYNSKFTSDEIFKTAFEELKSSAICEKEVEISQLVDNMHVGSYLREGYRILGISI